MSTLPQDSWPDWQDSGKRIEIALEDGRTVQAVLFFDDFDNDGCDEFPIWRVRLDDGSEESFAANIGWRFL